jgi:hypothetical protein
MVGNMYRPEKTTKMIYPVFEIEYKIFKNKKQEPIEKRVKCEAYEMKLININKDHNVNAPKHQIYAAV